MRNRIVPVLALVALPLLAAPAFARGGDARYGGYSNEGDSGPYVGFSVGQFNYKESGLQDINPGIGQFRFGAYIGPNLAIEGRVGRSLGWTTVNGFGLEVQNLYGGYLKGIVPVSNGFALYGLAGLTSVQLHRDYGTLHSNDNGFSYGVGAEFRFPNRMVISAEYARLLTGTNLDNNVAYHYDANMGSIGLAWRF
jgi:opacity protein-like surface antigen